MINNENNLSDEKFIERTIKKIGGRGLGRLVVIGFILMCAIVLIAFQILASVNGSTNFIFK